MNNISMNNHMNGEESSRRDLFIDMVVDMFIFKNNEITLSPCFTFIPKIGVGLRKTGVSFHCAGRLAFITKRVA